MKNKTYDHIRARLGNDYDLHLTNDEIDQVMLIGNREKINDQNVGYFTDRLKHNDREKAFHDEWYEENKIAPGINFGNGTLQGLFTSRAKNNLGGPKIDIEVNKRERQIVASIVQWLGTNCGFSFLEMALKRCGYRITKIEKTYE